MFLAFSLTPQKKKSHMNAAHTQLVFNNEILYQELFMGLSALNKKWEQTYI